MKIAQCYNSKAGKLCHRAPGDLIQLSYNDGTIDKALYLVLYMGKSTYKHNVADIATGITSQVHTSTRCIWFEDAIVVPEPDD